MVSGLQPSAPIDLTRWYHGGQALRAALSKTPPRPIRPVGAVHMTAGHNALRGSGPGQKLAFDNAMALVGCPAGGSTGSASRAFRPPNLHDETR
jgi:hypothetical protein